MDDEVSATMITNMYAGSLAAQVIQACEKARVKVTGRRIEAALRLLVPEGAADSPAFHALLPLVESQVARIQAAAGLLR
ncbi:hypothetical protein Amn_23540 [Aminobacter sp. Y103A]|uniref:hypothetical protein n=1 Tax=Aminobacter sp. Y103A TaxID=1870862 RepID=UPI0025723C61|nr:hypothetical protein [Aminobacter sp. SS-2016]BBD37474.1 hypothetical protein Amn_23540 [Aminobacter sp. SS-2016]